MDNLITGFFGLGGVLIGAILTPIITYWMEKIKRKNEIKANLLKCLYIYHSYWKMNLRLANTIRFKMREANDYERLMGVSESDSLRRRYEFIKDDLIRKQENNLEFSKKRMELAGEIDFLLAQTLQYFDEKKYKAIERPISAYLKDCQGNKYFFDYLEMESLPALQEVLKKVTDKQELMEKERERLVKLVLSKL